MSSFFITIIVGISLSMDAFSLSLIYGTKKFSQYQQIILSIIVGIYHFVMPLLGLFCGTVILKILRINPNIIVSFIFLIIGLEMILSITKKETKEFNVSYWGFLLFGLSVSIDSLTTGIGLSVINHNYFQASIIFSIISCLFTYLGLNLGNKLNDLFGNASTFLGGIILLFIGILYLFKV